MRLKSRNSKKNLILDKISNLGIQRFMVCYMFMTIQMQIQMLTYLVMKNCLPKRGSVVNQLDALLEIAIGISDILVILRWFACCRLLSVILT